MPLLVYILSSLFLFLSFASSSSPTCALNGTPCPTPTWPVEWNLTRSTMCQPGNTNGYFVPPSTEPWGLVSLDWSVAMGIWLNANRRNSTCEATSVQGCKLLKANGSATRCFIYHNMELALEWLESQREVMYDPAHADYFLRYKNGTVYNEPISQGDQFFWNFSNPQAAAYFVSSVAQSISDPNVDGTFTDDVTGVPAEHPNVPTVLDMTPQQLAELQNATQETSQILIDTLVKYGKYNWQAFGNQDGVATGPTPSTCTTFMRQYCQASYQNYPLALQMDNSAANKNQTVAAFLIVRPPYGWLGWGWESDSSDWDPIFLLDAGEPTGECEESPTGVFWRKWTMGTPELNCNTWSAQLPFASL